MNHSSPTHTRKRHWRPRRWASDLKRRSALARRGRQDPPATSYLAGSRAPLGSLLYVLPLIAFYEGCALWVGEGAGSNVRTGADLWLRSLVGATGLPVGGLVPLAICSGLLLWHFLDKQSTVPRPGHLVLMAVESGFLAVALIGVSRLLDQAITGLEQHQYLLQAGTTPRPFEAVVGFVGAGVYEEALFRLALVPLFYNILKLLQSPELVAGTLAVTGSSLAFALAHHVGQPVEVFTWYVFFFRWMAGVYFAGIFLLRGFGVAVGAHAAYDIMVGSLDWHL